MKKLTAAQVKKLSSEKKIDYIIDQLEKIDHAVNPSFLHRLISWFGSHWFVLLILGTLTYFGLQLWDEIQAILDFMEKMNTSIDNVQTEFGEVKTQVQDVQTRVSEAFRGIQFWKN